MIQQQFLSKLRNRKCINVFDTKEKTFMKIQLNKKENFICWERYVSKDRQNWVLHNSYLSLHDIENILNKIRENIIEKNKSVLA